MSATSPVRNNEGCESLLKLTKPGTRAPVVNDNRTDREKRKDRANAKREDLLRIKHSCSGTDALKTQNELVLNLADAIAKMTGLFRSYPSGVGVAIHVNETNRVTVFREEDVKIMRQALENLVKNYEIIYAARRTREPGPPQDPANFKNLQYSRVILTAEGSEWVNNENFGINVKNDILNILGKDSWDDTLMSQGIMLRGTLNALVTMALSGRKIDQPARKAIKGVKLTRRPALFRYTNQMLASFGRRAATYDYGIDEAELANKKSFVTFKVPNKTTDSVLEVLKRKYDDKVAERDNLVGKHRNAIAFNTEELIYPYARSMSEWIILTEEDARIEAGKSQDVSDALSDPKLKNDVQRDLIVEYNAVTSVSEKISEDNRAAKASTKKKRTTIMI